MNRPTRSVLTTVALVPLLLSLAGCGGGGNVTAISAPGGQVLPKVISRASVGGNNTEADNFSIFSCASLAGEMVAFESPATNLVPNDTNGFFDVFVRYPKRGETVRVSVASDGAQSNEHSGHPSISADGNTVAFASDASNLVPNDTNGMLDIFVHDVASGATTRVNLDSAGNQSNGFSIDPQLSADGRFVVFESDATNLVPNDTNGVRDIFLHDRQTGATTRVSTDSAGGQADNHSDAAFLSGDGNFVIFGSDATNLVPGDTNGVTDVFVKNLATGATTRVSVDSLGVQGDQTSGGWERSASLSADGRFAAFESWATNLVTGDTNGVADVFVHDMQTGTTTRASVDSAGLQGDGEGRGPVLSADGRFVSFDSAATNLVPNDTNGVADLFIHDRTTGQTVRISLDANGTQGNGMSVYGCMSPDGTAVSFESEASNLVPNDTNGVRDVFLAPNPLIP